MQTDTYSPAATAGDEILTLYHVDYHATGATLPVTGFDPTKLEIRGGAVHARADAGTPETEQTFTARIRPAAVFRLWENVYSDPVQRRLDPLLEGLLRTAFPRTVGLRTRQERRHAVPHGVAAHLYQFALEAPTWLPMGRDEWRQRGEAVACLFAMEKDGGFQAVETQPGRYIALPGLTFERCKPEASKDPTAPSTPEA